MAQIQNTHHFDTPLDGVVGDPTLVVQAHGPQPAIPGPPPSGGTVEAGYEGPTEEPSAWQTFAACTGVDPALFFPERGAATREAKAVCATCPVREECLEYALEHGEKFGIWGGKSERERRQIRRERGISKPRGRHLKPCGTPAAYQRHLNRGEPTCAACRAAIVEKQRQQRAQRRGDAA
jgi:WhiB family redox-sensing transcriptional regulator